LLKNCLLNHVIEGKIEGRIEVMGIRGWRGWQDSNELKGERGYWKLKEEALDCTLWRTRFGRGCGPVVRQAAEWWHLSYNTVDTCYHCGMTVEAGHRVQFLVTDTITYF
jgi:hypothetical protein